MNLNKKQYERLCIDAFSILKKNRSNRFKDYKNKKV